MSNGIQILVTGAGGQLGSELKYLSAEYSNLDFYFRSSAELDVTDAYAMEHALSAREYDFLINCSAYTAVDKAESDLDRAFAINATAAGDLSVACAKHNVKFIHISTDFVFDGKSNRPYLETDEVHPIGVYGASKEQGERLVLEASPDALVIRTSWLYSSFGGNFVKTMRRLGSERSELKVIFDQVGTPTYARDLARIILESIQSGKIASTSGLFHFSNEGVASWYDFAIAIMEMSKLSCSVLPINTYEYPTPAQRPHYSVLDKRKIKEALGISIPYWRDSLKTCIQTLENEK
ncbi:dTDP-4-dehydrorhamnose reductase [soil metagenome]